MNKKISPVTIILLILLFFITHNTALAQTNAGIKPSSFFYFIDIAIERTVLLFTFNPEKKIEKLMLYADERIAEVEESTRDNKFTAAKKALSDYEEKIALITQKTNEIKDDVVAEELLSVIAESIFGHQGVLEDILERVPDEAVFILKAIEVSEKESEKVTELIEERRGTTDGRSERLLEEARRKLKEFSKRESILLKLEPPREAEDAVIQPPPYLPKDSATQSGSQAPSSFIPPLPALPTDTESSQAQPESTSQPSNGESSIPRPPSLPD